MNLGQRARIIYCSGVRGELVRLKTLKLAMFAHSGGKCSLRQRLIRSGKVGLGLYSLLRVKRGFVSGRGVVGGSGGVSGGGVVGGRRGKVKRGAGGGPVGGEGPGNGKGLRKGLRLGLRLGFG
jgi:hypothetical protein